MPTSVRKMDQLLVNELGFTRRTGRHQIYVLELGGRQVVRTLSYPIPCNLGQKDATYLFCPKLF